MHLPHPPLPTLSPPSSLSSLYSTVASLETVRISRHHPPPFCGIEPEPQGDRKLSVVRLRSQKPGLPASKENLMLTREIRVGFYPADVALAFIGAMAQEALEPWDGRVFYFEYTNVDSPVRILLQSAPGAPTARNVRSIVMWVLKQLPIDLFNGPSIWGLDFRVQLSGQDLYFGKMSNKNMPAGLLEHGAAQGGNSSLGSSEQSQKRVLLMSQPSNTAIASTEGLNLTNQLANAQYNLRFKLAGLPLRDIDMFSTILEFLLSLGVRDLHQVLGPVCLAHNTLPVWIYVLQSVEPGSTLQLHVYQLVTILQAIASYCVARNLYREVSYDVLMNDALLASGCMVRGTEGREWCRGLVERMGTDAPVLSLDLNQRVSVRA